MTQQEKLLSIATAEIGTKENPPNSNNIKYNTWFYKREVHDYDRGPKVTYPWCTCFVLWCFEQAQLTELWLNGNIRESAYCPYIASQSKKLKQWVTSNYKPGDCVIFDFSGKKEREQHIGILESINADGTLTCIEGNTSSTSNDNGGAVMRRVRNTAVVIGAFRPKFTEVKLNNTNNQTEEEIEVRYQRLKDIPETSNFRNIINLLMNAKVINGDGCDPTGNNDVIDLSHDMVRMIVLTYRGGAYDTAIKAAGLNPGVFK